ncbi:MAG: type II toxin-antitoxin system VapC family toxin [Chloroflexi bacterium]|nr:type II toxin-antitoxin system VapC family toxin [Chloroflexota bacterium]
MRLTLDTSAYSQLMSGEQRVSDLVRRADEVFLSAIVFGELMAGFRKGSRLDRNVEELRAFFDAPNSAFATVGQTTADRYARIKDALRARGRPLPANDVWIAAHAMETGADLVSADRHFENVDGIALILLQPR